MFDRGSTSHCLRHMNGWPCHLHFASIFLFPNGDITEYAANIIAENMLTQVDSMAHKSCEGILRARYVSFHAILLLKNIKWPLAEILIWKNSTISL
jgi:hypothetical protein